MNTGISVLYKCIAERHRCNRQTCFECDYSKESSSHVSDMCFKVEAEIRIFLQFFEACEVEPMLFAFKNSNLTVSPVCNCC